MAGGGIPFEVFLEFSLLLVAAAFAGALFMKLKQPALVAFLVIGIAIGPSGLNLTQTDENVALLAVVGVIVLLGMFVTSHNIAFIYTSELMILL